MAATKYGKKELERLWVKAGGPFNEAKTAAAISLAESGGSPTAKNPEGPEHAEGLWQIKGQVVKGNPFSPEVSAANAVAKYNAAKGFSPWTTFTEGTYRSFLNAGESLSTGEAAQALLEKGSKEGPKGAGELAEGVEDATGVPVKGVGEAIDSVGGFLGALGEPSTWLRLAEGVGGVILFFVGLKTLTRGTAGATVVNAPVQGVKSAGKKAVEAAAAAAA